MPDILETIADHSRARVERELTHISRDEMRARAEASVDGGRPSLYDALSAPGMSFICECKKASPSKGLIAPEFPYRRIVREYEDAGAAAISVLTEPDFFLGSDVYLSEIAHDVALPVLRKDFIVDDFQIFQAATLGASAVLLICSLLDIDTLRDRLRICESLGLDALVEAHDDSEIESALAVGARIIGINNRNLRDFSVDFTTTVRLRERIPAHVLTVAESGIKTPDDVAMLGECGFDAVLVGEVLMRADDKTRALSKLKEGCR